jgi:pimeloyl-ACP methyl ester carboxylesterase
MMISTTTNLLFATAAALTVATAIPAHADQPSANAGSKLSTMMLKLPDGQIAYDDSGGAGPLVICVPGLGDLRRQYRFLAPKLVAAGFRVVTMDLPGHGDSSVDWPAYSPALVGADIVAMVGHLGPGKAFILGNSMAAGSAVWAAAEIPDHIAGIVLIDPFTRVIPTSSFLLAFLKVAMMRPWGPSFWSMYYRSLYKSAPPADLDSYRAALVANLKQPGHIEATSALIFASQALCEARIPQVRAPVLVVMGTRDSDFDDPAAEADWVAAHLHGKKLMVDGAGHYPHVEYPDILAAAVIDFVREAQDGEAGRN